MAELTKMYKVVYGQPAPVEVMAEKPCYPNHDADGDQIFANTHFLNLADAWTRHLAEHRAGWSLANAALQQVRDQLAKASIKAVDASMAYWAAQEAHRNYTGVSRG